MYNVAPYVERCIRSLEDQDLLHEDFEIICINDGSPDNCSGVVSKLKKEYDNIVLIDQENQGVSMARNNGIAIAKGKYLLMVDPDDYVKPNTLREKLDIIGKYDLDVGFIGYIILNEDGKEEYRYDPIFDQSNVLSGIDYFNKYVWGRSEIRDSHRSWAIFFKASFWKQNSLRYPPDVPYLEDGELIARVDCLAQRVSFINKPFYLRTTRPGSATHSNLYYSEKARNGFLKAANNLLQFRKNQCVSNEQKVFMNQPIIHFTILYIFSHGLIIPLKKIHIIKNKLKQASLIKLSTEGCSKYYRRMARYYNCSIYCFVLYYIFHRFYNSFRIRINRLNDNMGSKH